MARFILAAVFAIATLAACSSPPPPPVTASSAATATPSASAPATPAPATPASSAPTDAPLLPANDSSEAPTKIGARHVLIQWIGCDHAAPSVVRTREQALSLAKEVLQRARSKEDFARLAVEYSDEPGAGGRGGSLGRFGHGQMVPAFEAAAFKLRVGEISDIVETPFGFHVIQRTE